MLITQRQAPQCFEEKQKSCSKHVATNGVLRERVETLRRSGSLPDRSQGSMESDREAERERPSLGSVIGASRATSQKSRLRIRLDVSSEVTIDDRLRQRHRDLTGNPLVRCRADVIPRSWDGGNGCMESVPFHMTAGTVSVDYFRGTKKSLRFLLASHSKPLAGCRRQQLGRVGCVVVL